MSSLERVYRKVWQYVLQCCGYVNELAALVEDYLPPLRDFELDVCYDNCRVLIYVQAGDLSEVYYRLYKALPYECLVPAVLLLDPARIGDVLYDMVRSPDNDFQATWTLDCAWSDLVKDPLTQQYVDNDFDMAQRLYARYSFEQFEQCMKTQAQTYNWEWSERYTFHEIISDGRDKSVYHVDIPTW